MAITVALIEGRRHLTWLLRLLGKNETIEMILVTDEKGQSQIIDLPADEYNSKLVLAGEELISVKSFNLPYGYLKRDVSTKLDAKESLRLKERLLLTY